MLGPSRQVGHHHEATTTSGTTTTVTTNATAGSGVTTVPTVPAVRTAHGGSSQRHHGDERANGRQERLQTVS